jgi:hypothetical protein
MRHLPLISALVLAAVLPAPLARAQSETDRLREALRAATVQMRTLEDQRAALQARVTEAERQRQMLQAELDAARAQVKAADDIQNKAIEEFNARIAERDQTLDKWKTAYEQAADVARAKDAERAKFEAEAATFKGRATSCEAKNAQLLKTGKEIVEGYRDLTLLDHAAIREPMFGLARVAHQNCVQDYLNKMLDQDAKNVPALAPAAQPAGQKGADQKAADQKAADQKTGDQKPTDQKTVNAKPKPAPKPQTAPTKVQGAQ